jgi:hypothetical protein
VNVHVPPGKVLRYGYVEHGRIGFNQYGGIYLPAVQRHLDALVNIGGGAQPSECPYGRWDGERFVILDGRHRYTAAVIAGFRHLLVRWLEEDPTAGESNNHGGNPPPVELRVVA